MSANTSPFGRRASLRALGLCGVFAAAGLAVGCDDDEPAHEGGGDATVRADGQVDGDSGGVPDAQPDALAHDAGPPPHLDAPEALVYLNDPITDEGQLTRVTLNRTVPEDGRLTSEYVSVFNCLNEAGGASGMPDFGGLRITVSLCHEVQTALPGPDGHYTHILPPEDDSDPNDAFAELMMYHHVNRVHDYFKNTHGFAELDYALPALVNLQFRTDPPLPIPGFMPGPDGWIPFANAAFFPQESWDQFAAQFGLPPRDSDSIIFGQADQDFSYDARVIYHEYSHAVIGTERLQVIATVDEYGLDNSARSMNEGLADYFAGSISDDPVIGRYGLGTIDISLQRDLSVPHKCPANTEDEVHDHGQVIGSAMWALRDAMGAEAADAVLFAALLQFTESTSHQEAGALLQAEAEARGLGEVAEPILSDFGLLGCERAVPWVAFDARTTGTVHVVEGRQTTGLPGLSTGVPGYKQFYVDVPAGAAAVTLSWTQLSSSSIFGGSTPVALELGYRKGVAIELGATSARRYDTLDERLAPPLLGDAQSVTLVGDCLPAEGGRIYLLPINSESGASNIGTMDIAFPATAPSPGAGRTIVSCGAEPDPDMGVEDMGASDLGAPDLGAEDLGASDAGVDAAPLDAGDEAGL